MSERKANIAADRKARSVVFKTLEGVSLVEIKDAITKETNAESIVVLQELRPQEYLAEFKEKDDVEKIIEIGFDLASSHITCNPPKGYYINVSLMGLRACIEDKKVVETLSRYGEIKSPVIRLKYKIGHDLAGLENGNRLVKIVLNQPSIPYSLKIDGEWCRIIHSSQQPYCSTCSEFGHIARKLNTISAKNMDILSLTAQPRQTTTPVNKRRKKRVRPQPETPKTPRQ